MRVGRLIPVLASLLLAGCAMDSPLPTAARDGWTTARFATLGENIRAAGEVQLLEGLPHQLVERGSFEREMNSKPTVQIGGYSFYRRPLPLAAKDAAALRALCADPGTYSPYTGPKTCGGFHPDHCIVWRDGERTSYALICFGCREMETLGAGRRLIADLPAPAYRQFQDLLRPYHAQRPAYERGG